MATGNRAAAKGAMRLLVVSLVVALASMAMSGLILRDFGRIVISNAVTETRAGDRVALRIYRPRGADGEHPAPAIIMAHGLSTNKESYAQYGLELARRGFVVITPDLLNHGSSKVTPPQVFLGPADISDAYGAYAAVRYAKGLAYVSAGELGVAGHSAGGQAANNMVRLDDAEPDQSIRAVYLISSEPMYKDGDHWANLYGSRDVGVYHTRYDHVYFTTVNDDGTTVPAQDWLMSDSAKSLFSFGGEPAAFNGDAVKPGRRYTATIDGRQAFRQVTSANEIHPQAQEGTNALAAMVDFFEASFDAPAYRPGSDQLFHWYQLFNVIGFAALLAFGVAVVGVVMSRIRFLAVDGPGIGADTALRPAPRGRAERLWFWGLTVLNCLFAFVSITLIFKLGLGYFSTKVLAQQPTNIYAFWAGLNGLFMLASAAASRRLRDGRRPRARRSPAAVLRDGGRELLVCLIALGGMLALVELGNRVFFTDFRFYLWGIRDVPGELFGVFLTYLPFYLVFGIAVSVTLNGACHCRIAHEPQWANDLFFAVLNLIPALVVTLVGYLIFMHTKVAPNVFGAPSSFTYTINAIPMFPIAVVFIRRLFKRCGNLMVPGVIAGVLLCWMQVSCSVTLHSFVWFGITQ